MKTLRVLIFLTASLALSAGTIGCGGNNGSNAALTTDEAASTNSADTTTETSESSTPGVETGKVGSSLTLDDGAGEKLVVTVTGVTKNLRKGEYDTVTAGHTLYGVTLIVQNAGKSLYNDSPDSSSTLVLSNDEQVDYSSASPPSCQDPSTIRIAPGAKRRLCVPFEIPRGSSPKTFQFTFQTSTSSALGEWSLS